MELGGELFPWARPTGGCGDRIVLKARRVRPGAETAFRPTVYRPKIESIN
jgi:hypothetical protein